MTLTMHQRALLDVKLRSEFVPHLPILIQPKNPGEDAKKNLSRAFAGFAIAALCKVSAVEGAKAVVDDFDDFGLDAIHFHAPSDTLYLLQAKMKDGVQVDQADANAFCQGVRRILEQNFDGFNENVLRLQEKIAEAYETCSQIKLVIAEIGGGLSVHADMALKQMIKEERPSEQRLAPEVVRFDSAAVMRHLQSGHAYPQIDENLTVESWISRQVSRRTHIGFVTASTLADLHRRHGVALYARNIRHALGPKTDVNRAIAETLHSATADFEYLNNGVTILADRVEPKGKQGAGRKLKLMGLSVINGAQTISSCAAFADAHPDHGIEGAFVPVTIIEADGDVAFGDRVTRARNHQNPVVRQNFAALDPEQERLRRELEVLGVRYAYKAEARDGTADPDRIDIMEAAQALALFSTDPRMALLLKREPSQLLVMESDVYRQVFPDGVAAMRLLNAVRLNHAVQGWIRGQEVRAKGQERLTYRHGAPAFAFMLAKRVRAAVEAPAPFDGARLLNAPSAPLDTLRQALWDEVQPMTRSKGPLAIFRNATDTLPLLDTVMTATYGLAGDPVLPFKNQKTGEPYNVARFEHLALKAPQIGGLA